MCNYLRPIFAEGRLRLTTGVAQDLSCIQTDVDLNNPKARTVAGFWSVQAGRIVRIAHAAQITSPLGRSAGTTAAPDSQPA
jgi:hypothetical protein